MFGKKDDAPQSLAELDNWCATVDATAEVERAHGGKTSKATINAGEAAVAAVKARRWLT